MRSCQLCQLVCNDFELVGKKSPCKIETNLALSQTRKKNHPSPRNNKCKRSGCELSRECCLYKS